MNQTSAHTDLVPFFSLPQILFRVIKIVRGVPYRRSAIFGCSVVFVVLCGDTNICTVL